MKVVLWPNLAKVELLERFAKIAGIELAVVDGLDGLTQAIGEAGVLVIAQSVYDRRVAEALRDHGKRLRFVQLLTAGYDGPQMYGVPPGVVVSNAGDSWSPMLAEHAMTLTLTLIRCVPQILENHAKHGWERKFTACMDSVDGKTMAIVGYGSIGREVAKRARSFGMHVIGVSRSAKFKPFADEVQPVSRLRGVLARADVIVLAAPLTPETEHLIDAQALAACKKNAVLINVARGGLIDQASLAAALKNGTIAGAGLDVTDPEPLPPDNPLWECPNLIISPHVAGVGGVGGRVRLASFAGDNVERFISGQSVTHAVTL